MAATPTAKAEDKVDAPSPSPEANQSNLPEAQRPPGDLRRRGQKEKRKGPFVKYVGAASHREITATDWLSLNLEVQDKKATNVWNVANDKLVEADKFSDDQLDYLLIDDLQQGTNTHAFLLVDYNADGELVQAVYE